MIARLSLLCLMAICFVPHQAVAADPGEAARFVPKWRDPALEELRKQYEDYKEYQGKETAAIRKRQKEEAEKKRREERTFQSSLPLTEIPASPNDFKSIDHLPPVPQYMAGTCWSFAATSLLESEAHRLTGQQIKLSEHHTIYWEYVEKARRFVRERGASHFAEGSEANAVTRIWKQYGAVPLEAYPGVAKEVTETRHDHQRLTHEMTSFLEFVKSTELWDEELVLAMLRAILDRHLGPPPTRFTFKGKPYTPLTFMHQVLKIDSDAYVSLMSTMAIPYFTWGRLEVPDNWWHSKDYFNVPLEEFSAAMKASLNKGWSLVPAYDTSEPGNDSLNDVMFIPSYDIPTDAITQQAREYRFVHNLTTDDHGTHMVGYLRFKDHDWFLLKDSNRSSRRGRHQGYYFMRGDYARLKVLSILVHKDAVADLLAKQKPVKDEAKEAR